VLANRIKTERFGVQRDCREICQVKMRARRVNTRKQTHFLYYACSLMYVSEREEEDKTQNTPPPLVLGAIPNWVLAYLRLRRTHYPRHRKRIATNVKPFTRHSKESKTRQTLAPRMPRCPAKVVN